MRIIGWALSFFLVLSAPIRSEPPSQPAPDPDGDREVIERFLEVWTRKVGIYGKNRWLGVQTLQNPLDAWVTQEVIARVRPDVIVETGTWKGGSAPYWAMVLEQVQPKGRVITIDVEDRTADAQKLGVWKRRIDFLLGSSTDPEILAEVKRRTAGKRVLVILDSLHSYEHVLAELRLYAPLVSRGSYLIVQDTGLWRPAENPDKPWASDAVKEFLAENDTFAIDKTRERFMITNNPDGYLLRVR